MTLYDKILKVRPNLKLEDFELEGTIVLQNDSNGKGDYIKEWNHPTETKPTKKEIDGV